MSQLIPRHGNIDWVELLDPQGRNPKVRPAVVITPTSEITSTGEVVVVGITSPVNDASPEVTVDLPWHRNGHPRTKLSRASVAVCNWKASVPITAIHEIKGHVPVPEMMRILQIVGQLEANGEDQK